MIDRNKPYCTIQVVTKGGELKMLEMQTDSENWDFERWFSDRYQHEPMLHVPGTNEYIAFDSILSMKYYDHDGIDF